MHETRKVTLLRNSDPYLIGWYFKKFHKSKRYKLQSVLLLWRQIKEIGLLWLYYARSQAELMVRVVEVTHHDVAVGLVVLVAKRNVFFR